MIALILTPANIEDLVNRKLIHIYILDRLSPAERGFSKTYLKFE